MSKILDFDKFISEKKKETITVTVLGKDYPVSMEIPAIVPVMMARAEASLDQQQSTKMVMRAADAMLGPDNVDEMCAHGLSAGDLANLVQQLFKEINEGSDDEEDIEEVTDEDSRVQTGAGKRAKK